MHSLSSLFHRKGSPKPNPNPNPTQDPNIPNTNYPANTTTTTATHYAPGTGPLANAQLHNANNLGMASGALLASDTGGDPVLGMIEGQVAAGMITQRIQQGQKHQFFRERAMEYREGLARGEATGGGGGAGEGDEPRSRSQRREEKRRKRWERRAGRRDGAGAVGGVGGVVGGVGRAASVSSEEEEDGMGKGKD